LYKAHRSARRGDGKAEHARAWHGSRIGGEQTFEGGFQMLSWALTFLVIALIAGLLGFTGIAGAATGIAKILFVVFLVIFLISLVAGRRGSAPL
jgi:uncharacterized membrane protein YtjA (UPF0391 family)